ncbi:nucleotide-binding domain-containing protein [Ramicandelaber brevisporus]|nr:nucleotide-binding domain-containing protein [Ramicandelaber brevisporus]
MFATATTEQQTLPPFNVAVVGSGPAGFYTAARLLSRYPDTTSRRLHIDIIEKLPVPHGLVRYGVAPDHPEVKLVMNKFDQVAADPRCRFIGNISVGTGDAGAIAIDDLRQWYDAVVFAYGASQDRKLGITGESEFEISPWGHTAESPRTGSGVLAARAFVGWYNGLPEHRNLPIDLSSTERVSVIGQGNVALDVARVLLSDIDVLAKTDITEHALEQLRKSRVRHIDIVGRRGPLQVAFTTKEFREMFSLGSDVRFDSDAELIASEAARGKTAISSNRPLKRLVEFMTKQANAAHQAQSSLSPAERLNQERHGRSWKLSFLRSPVEFVGRADGNSGISSIRYEINRLEGHPASNPAALTADDIARERSVGTGAFEAAECDLAMRSIGYKSTPIPGLPFDDRRGVVPNQLGRITSAPATSDSAEADVLPGFYASGWLKRGPVGVIASTMSDGYETGDSIVEDIVNNRPMLRSVEGAGQQMPPIPEIARSRGGSPVTYMDWQRLSNYEEAVGKQHGKPREKVTDEEEMVRIERSES